MEDQFNSYNCLCFLTEADSHSKLYDQTPMLYLTNKKAGLGFLVAFLFFFNLVLSPIVPFTAKKKLCSVMV